MQFVAFFAHRFTAEDWTKIYMTGIILQIKVKVVIYSPISPKAHGILHQLPPGIATLFPVSSLWGEYSAFSVVEASHTAPMFCSTWYQLLLGGQSWCGFKACPRLLRIASAAEIESQTPWSRDQRLYRLAICCTMAYIVSWESVLNTSHLHTNSNSFASNPTMYYPITEYGLSIDPLLQSTEVF